MCVLNFLVFSLRVEANPKPETLIKLGVEPGPAGRDAQRGRLCNYYFSSDKPHFLLQVLNYNPQRNNQIMNYLTKCILSQGFPVA